MQNKKEQEKDAARNTFSGSLTAGKTSVISLEVDWYGAIREVRDEEDELMMQEVKSNAYARTRTAG